MLKKESKEYIEEYLKRELTEKELAAIEKHCKRYNLSEVCAWYLDWEDFCSDWCDEIGYSRSQTRILLHRRNGEYKTIDTVEILRFVI